MRLNIYKDNVLINTIVADADFTERYCAKNGYTFEEVPDPVPEDDMETTIIEMMLDHEERICLIELGIV